MKVTLTSELDAYVWPFCFRLPMRESLEWLTDTITTNTGADARRRYRNKPRRSYEVQARIPWPLSIRAANILHDGANYPWLLPIWPERTVVSVAAGAGSISVDTDTAVYGDRAIVWSDPETWEIVDISSVGSGSITLSGTVQASYTDATVMPLRLGRIRQIPSASVHRDNAAFRFLWIESENYALAPAAPTQYQGADIYYQCPILGADGVDDGYVTRVDDLDELTGNVATFTPWLKNRRSRAHGVLKKTRAEAWELREWLHRRAGQLRSFWMPTYTRDIRITSTGALTDVVQIADDGYGERAHIAVLTTAGTWLPREVLSVDRVNATTLELTLDSALGINAADVEMVSYLIHYRLSVDRVELEHIGLDRVRATIPIIEVPA